MDISANKDIFLSYHNSYAISRDLLQNTQNRCRIVKHIGRGTQREKANEVVSSVTCWIGDYEQ